MGTRGGKKGNRCGREKKGKKGRGLDRRGCMDRKRKKGKGGEETEIGRDRRREEWQIIKKMERRWEEWN